MGEMFNEKKDYLISSEIQPNIVTKRIDSINDYFKLSMSIIDKYYQNYFFFVNFLLNKTEYFFGQRGRC